MTSATDSSSEAGLFSTASASSREPRSRERERADLAKPALDSLTLIATDRPEKLWTLPRILI